MGGWREALTDLVQESVRDGLPPEDVAGNAVCVIATLADHQRIALARELLPEGWVAIERKDMAPLVDLERAEQRRKVLGDSCGSFTAKSSDWQIWNVPAPTVSVTIGTGGPAAGFGGGGLRGVAAYPRVPES